MNSVPVDVIRTRTGLYAGLLSTFVLLLASVAVNANLNLKPLLISSYIGLLSIPPALASYLVSIEAATSALVTAGAAAWLLTRVRARQIYLVAALIIIAGNIASIWAHSFQTMAFARALSGIGHGTGQALCAAAIAAFARPARISAAVAIIVSIAAMGLLFIIPALQARFGISPLFLAMAALTVPPLLLLWWFPQPSLATQAAQRDAGPIVLRGPVLLAMFGVASFYVSVGSFWPFVTEIGKSTGLSYQEASGVAAIAYLAAMAGALTGAVLVEYVARHVLTALAILGAVTTQILLVIGPHGYAAFAGCTVLYMFCWGVLYPLFMGFFSEVDPFGRLNGYVGTLATIGIALGPTLGGAVIGLSGPKDGLHNLVWMSGLFLLASLSLVQAMRQRAILSMALIRK